MKIIFLDIDGVLATLATKYHHGDPACVRRLNALTTASGASIVVSSTWRKGGLRSIRRILKGWGVTAPVYDITPDLSAQRGELALAVPRGREIQAWLDTSTDIMHFVILDDTDDMEHLKPLLVQPDPYKGLQFDDCERALHLLGRCAWCALGYPAVHDAGLLWHTLRENETLRVKQECAR